MNPKIKILFLVLAVSVLVVGCGYYFYVQKGRSEEVARRVTCLSRIQQIGQAIEKFKKANNGNYPQTLLDLSPLLDSPKALRCPGDIHAEASNDNYSSYVYTKPETPPNPNDIIISERQGNHSQWGKDLAGYSILRANGSFEWVKTQ